MSERIPTQGMESEEKIEKNGLAKRARKLWLTVAAMGALAMGTGTGEAQQTHPEEFERGADAKDKIFHLEQELSRLYVADALENLPIASDTTPNAAQDAVDSIEVWTEEINGGGIVQESLPSELVEVELFKEPKLSEAQQIEILQKSIDDAKAHGFAPVRAKEHERVLENEKSDKETQEHIVKMTEELDENGFVGESLPKDIDTFTPEKQIDMLTERVMLLQSEILEEPFDEKAFEAKNALRDSENSHRSPEQLMEYIKTLKQQLGALHISRLRLASISNRLSV